MKTLFLSAILTIASILAMAQPAIPTKLFDVRNGNGIVDSGTTYPQAVTIVFKDLASAQAVYDAFASQYGYTATIPDPANPGQTIANPQSKKQFFMAKVTLYIKDTYRADAVNTATKAAGTSASATVDGVVPPKN